MRGALSLCALLALAPLASAQRGGKGALVHWKGERYALDALPASLEKGARAALLEWGPWAAEHALRLDLEERQRVLLASPEDGARHARWLELEARTLALFDELLPAPARRPSEPPPAPPEPKARPGELPEDPEEGPAGAGLARGAPRPPAAPVATGVAEQPWPALLFVLPDEEAQGALLDALAARHEYLASWLPKARAELGFVLEEPLAGAFVLEAEGLEEWNPEAELVHRLTQLLLQRRFGRQPFWLEHGLAWLVEERLCGGMWCFPYRAEFVWATEHTGWSDELRRRVEKQRGPLKLESFAAWKRGTYEDGPARLSYGLMRYLVQEHSAALPAFLDALHGFRDRAARIVHEDGSWQKIPDYEIPLADLERLLTDAFGKDVLTKAAAWLRAGSHPPRAAPAPPR